MLKGGIRDGLDSREMLLVAGREGASENKMIVEEFAQIQNLPQTLAEKTEPAAKEEEDHAKGIPD